MDKSKAKKAVKKSESRKKSADAAAAQQMLMAMQGGAAIDPEIQAAQIAMQPVDGFVNPYHAMGAMAPMEYSPGNMIGGYNSPMMVNPET